MIIKHKIIQEDKDEVLVVYLDNNMEEFTREMGDNAKEREKNLLEKINDYIREKEIKFTGKIVKVVVGALVVATLSIGSGQRYNVEAKNDTIDNYVYVVQDGDNLSTIALDFGMSIAEIKDINNLESDIIYPGQPLLFSRDVEIGTYIVKNGDNLWTIAQKYGMSVEEIKKLNNVSDIIYPGEKLKVIQARTPLTYKVKLGDSLWSIANDYGISILELKSFNNLTTDVIYPGQELKINSSIATKQNYTVKAGDNLWDLARSFNTTVDNIKEFNNLTSNVIRPGQVLIIPTSINSSNNSMTININRSHGIVENISLEEYVVGVVAAELGAGFNESAYKAQALAARTYAVKNISEGKIITDTDSHQVYLDLEQIKNSWGETDFYKYYPLVEKAVNETRGEVITYKGEYIDAVYFSTSNGRTDLPQYVWGGELEYLQSVDSHWDTKSPYYYHVSNFTYNEFADRLGLSTTGLYSYVISRTANGSVNTINIGGRVFSGNYVKGRLGLRSTDFDIEFLNGEVTIEQRGWGHGVGLSQYGAYFMGEEGYTYQEIIHHYYQGVDIVNI